MTLDEHIAELRKNRAFLIAEIDHVERKQRLLDGTLLEIETVARETKRHFDKHCPAYKNLSKIIKLARRAIDGEET